MARQNGSCFDSCLFVVHGGRHERARIDRRLRALRAFYAPLGPTQLTVRDHAAADVVVGRITFGAEAVCTEPVSWGAKPPPALARPGAIVNASDRSLRALTGVSATVDCDGPRCRIVTSAGGLTTLYQSECDGLSVWATLATVAGYLAQGRAALDLRALAELMAVEFVGDERTHLRHVVAVPCATRVDLSRGTATSTSFWPSAERWARVPERAAYRHTEQALLEGLGERLAQVGHTALGMTAGMDSRVAAVAMRELGVSFSGFTWGDAGWEDLVQAEKVAATLGVPHTAQPVRWESDDSALRRTAAEVRWNEGTIPVGFAFQTWPAGMGAYAFGGGGEIGRTFYYRRAAARCRAPSTRTVSRSWDPLGRLAGAHPEIRSYLTDRMSHWIDSARADGARGWRILDVVYGEQRVKRWARNMLPRIGIPVVPVFATPEVARGLMSLPLEDRANDLFHRRFVARRNPGLAITPAPAVMVPGALRSHARQIRASASVRIRRGRNGSRAAAARATPGRWFAWELWPEHQTFLAWLDDDVLRDSIIVDGLGEEWAARIRAGLRAQEDRATELALRAAGPVCFTRALRELPVDA